MRSLYRLMRASSESWGRQEIDASRRIIGSPWRMAILIVLLLPVFLPLLVSADGVLPDAIGGKARFGPSFFSADLLLSTIGIGVVGGLITGCTGAGGGFVITPALMSLGIRGILAVGTDMLHIFASSLLGTTMHRRLGNVNVRLAIVFTVGSTVGVTVGGATNRALFEQNPVVSDLVISLSYVAILGFLGFYALADFLRANRAARAGESAAIDERTSVAIWLQKLGIPPMIGFGDGQAGGRVSAVLIVVCGLIVGFVAAILGAGGGFLTFPMFVYLLGVPTAVTAGTNSLQVIFTAGYGGIFQYAIHGYVFYTLAMGMLLGSLIGVQLGALTTSCVHPMYIKAFYAVAILAGFTNRLFSLPDSLTRLGVIQLDPAAGQAINTAGNALFFALVGLLAGWVLLTLIRNSTRLRTRSAAAAGVPDSGFIRDRSAFTRGVGLLGSFAIVLVLLVSPVFPQGRNGLQYADDMFNSLSKGSADFSGDQSAIAASLVGRDIGLSLSAGSDEDAAAWARLWTAAGATARSAGPIVAVNADLGHILSAALIDSSRAYQNDDSVAFGSHQLDARKTVYAWYSSLKEVERELIGVGRFEEGRKVNVLVYRSVEPAYNYYGVPISRVSDNVALLAAMLVFYVVYTIWYGAGMLFLFQGLGLTARKRTGNGHRAKDPGTSPNDSCR